VYERTFRFNTTGSHNIESHEGPILADSTVLAPPAHAPANANVVARNGPPTPDDSVEESQRSLEQSIPRDSYTSSTQLYPMETAEELVQCLSTYREGMFPFLPAVYINPAATPDELSSQRPFLWLVIRAITSKNSSRQNALVKQIQRTLGQSMLVEGKKSLDLLLGLIVLTAWGQYYISIKPLASALLHLATSLAAELGLAKKSYPESITAMLNFTAQGCPRPSPLGGAKTMEEKRALIGLFLIHSV